MVYLPAGKDWSVIVAVLGHALNNWTEFDGWAISNGFDPLELSSRRLVAAAWAFLTKDMDFEIKDSLIESLYAEATTIAATEPPKPKPQVGEVIVAPPKERWRAPKGWKPPGWNEEQSYKNSLSLMSDIK